MKQITKQQYDSLKKKIYDTLMAMPDMGLGEAGEAMETAETLIDDWMKENNIELVN